MIKFWTQFGYNKELFDNAPPYMDNLTLWKRVPFIYHTKELSNYRAKWKYDIQLGQILYPVKTNRICGEEKYYMQQQKIQYSAMINRIYNLGQMQYPFKTNKYPVKTITISY